MDPDTFKFWNDLADVCMKFSLIGIMAAMIGMLLYTWYKISND